MFGFKTREDTKDQRFVLGRTGRFSFFPRFTINHQVRKFHTYIVGLTGRGKSKLLQNLLVQDILAGRGCAIVDPHGDLAKDVLHELQSRGHFNDKAHLDRVMYVAPRRRDYVVPFNVLKRPDEDTETYEIAQRVISSFMRTWARTLAEPPRFQQIMRSALGVLIETNGTLIDLYRLLTDDDFRNSRLKQIINPKVSIDAHTFFANEFDQWGRDRPRIMSSTTNKASALIENPSLYYMLGHTENHLDIRSIMDRGKVLLVDLGDCDDETKRLFGTLIVTGFEQAALSRAKQPYEKRSPYYLYIDEFQDFAHQPGAAETFSQMLSQVRKFGLHLILANQSIAQLPQGLQRALGNAQTMISFRVSRADAEVMASILGKVDVEAVKREGQTEVQHPVYSPLHEQREEFIQILTKLNVRQFVVSTSDDRQAVLWAEKVLSPTAPLDELEKLIRELLHRHGVRLEQPNQEDPLKPDQTVSKGIFTG